MKKVFFCFAGILLCFATLFHTLGYAELQDSSADSFDWSKYSYHELLAIYEDLTESLNEAARQYAIENGNRKIVFSNEIEEIMVGRTSTIDVRVDKVVEDAPDRTNLIWKSSDDSIVRVAAGGRITGVAGGTAEITCTAQDDEYIFSTITVIVRVPVSNVVIKEKEITMLLTDKDDEVSQTVVASVLPENADCKTISWTSNNEEAVIVEDGKITAIAPGTAVITASSDDPSLTVPKTATCKVVVKQAISSVKLDTDTIKLNKNSSQTLQAIIAPDNASEKRLNWESSDPGVVRVAANGQITGVSCGTSIVTCSATDGSGCKSSCIVQVVQMATGIALDRTGTLTLNGNETYRVKATVQPSNATTRTLRWESSDNNVATVDISGKITALRGGEATITCATVDGSEKTASINVLVSPFTIGKKEYTINEKTGIQIPIQYTGAKKDFQYSVANAQLFTISEEWVSDKEVVLQLNPNKAGTTELVLKDNSDSRKTVKIKITVDHSAAYDTTSYPRGDYKNILRTPSKYQDENISIYGRVLQVGESGFIWTSKYLRVGTAGYDNVFYVDYSDVDMDFNVIEDDYITVYGVCTGTTTYTSLLGASITIPSMKAEKIVMGQN